MGNRLLAFSRRCEATGIDRLRLVCEFWVQLVVKHGGAMVHTRSDVGYLERLRDGTPYLTVQADALLPSIADAAAELGIADPGEEGLFLWNIMFDPREIFDLLRTVGMTREQAAHRLFRAFCGALVAWVEGDAGERDPRSRLSAAAV